MKGIIAAGGKRRERDAGANREGRHVRATWMRTANIQRKDRSPSLPVRRVSTRMLVTIKFYQERA